MQPLVEKRGHNGTIRVYEDYIELDRGFYNLAAWTAGLHGSHTFHFSDIASINFKRRGFFVGWIKFDVKTHNKEFVNNDYAITFGRHNDEWEQLADYIKETVYEYKRKKLVHVRARNGMLHVDKSHLLEYLELEME